MRTDAPTPRLTLAYVAALAVVAVLLRVAPYYLGPDSSLWNLVPVGALALFVGSRLNGWASWLVPLAVMFAADLLLIYPLARMGYPAFDPLRTPVIYLSYLAYVALGRLVGRDELSPPVVGGAALLAGVQFFLLTNFASWVVDCRSPEPMYTPTLAGLSQCFAMAVPFYKNTLASDLLGSAAVFGGHALLAWATRPAGIVRRDEVVR